MNLKPTIATILLAGISLCTPAASAEDAEQTKVKRMSPDNHAATELGRKVLDLQEAIRRPAAPSAMAAVTALGFDSRYYVMVRGWLSQQLEGDISILEANKERTPREVKERIEFLKKAIRTIDLE